MSQGKFASITSSLLARKGEAAPMTGNTGVPLAWRAESPAARLAAPPRTNIPPPAPPQTVKRCTVRLSQADYERLGLMAVKRNVTRQHLLQMALTDALAAMARAFPTDCACIGGACTRDCGGKT